MFSRFRRPLYFPNFKRNIHDLSRYVFVQDRQYDLLKKMREQSIHIPKVDPSYGMPSSFARNLLHPFSNHIVSEYAAEYYKTATPYYGEFPIQFFASEIYTAEPSKLPLQDTHSIIIYPEQVKISNIEKDHIPHILRLCNEEPNVLEEQVKNDYRIEKMRDISLYFFCDITSLERTFTLFQWFDICFRRSNYNKVNYVFSSGNMKNDQCSTIMVHNGSHNMVLSQYLTLIEVDKIVQHMISWKKK